MHPSRYFAGKKVVLTGGSSGIGRSTALRLAQAGANLILVGRRRQLLENVLPELEAHRQRPDQTWAAWPLDISDRAAVAALAGRLDHDDIDVLINNAGLAHADYIERTPAEVFEKMIGVNYLGTVWMTQALLPHFRRRGAGHIANVSSLAGQLGILGYAAYAPSKFAVLGFSEVLRNELCGSNIRVSVLLPPDTRTPQLDAENRTKPPETRAISGSLKPLDPDAVAQALLKGMAAGRFEILPDLGSRLTVWANRWFPGFTRWWLDRTIRSVQARVALSSPEAVRAGSEGGDVTLRIAQTSALLEAEKGRPQ
jgi:3-dehydrosphinganine reductase